MGTRRSLTWTLREFGNGCTAASSTWAVAARNFGLAFIGLPSAALPASGSMGISHPASAFPLWPGPRRQTLSIIAADEPGTGPQQYGRAADPHLGGPRPG